MAINYQRLILQMNRPERRTRGVLGGFAFPALACAVLAGGACAAWSQGLFPAPLTETCQAVMAALTGGDARAETPEAPQTDAPNRAAAAGSLPSALSNPVSNHPAGSVLNLNPAVPALPPAPPIPAKPDNQVRPEPPPSPARNDAPPPPPAPALSEARERLRSIDQVLNSDPAEALRRLENLLGGGRLAEDERAEASYRTGIAHRLLGDEEKAEKSWSETAEKWPASLGGRLSALALGDTWHQLYVSAGTRHPSRWDDVQALYSLVIGTDDAPFLPETVKAGIKERLNRLNDALFFGPLPTRLARYHKVENGELLGSIANRYRVDYESIARINGVDPNRIRAGMDLKLVTGDVSIVVRKNEKIPDRGPTVTWFLDGRWIREYPACVGDGVKTPAGGYNISSKEKDPSWTNPLNGQLLPNQHPDNILGSRWMAMKGMNTSGLGIHGTTIDDSVPGYASAGCVRLLNRDVEELFSFARIGGRVTVLE